MSRDDLARIDGLVKAVLGGGNYAVDLDNGSRIIARRSGKLRKHFIKVMAGDPVTVGVSTYDVSHGLILTRRRVGG
jgi:translation initiation factor IF-1